MILIFIGKCWKTKPKKTRNDDFDEPSGDEYRTAPALPEKIPGMF